MSDFVCNIAKGRVVELYNRVKSNDPSTSALVLVVLSAAGLAAIGNAAAQKAALEDADTLTAIKALAAEVTNGGGTPYTRIVLTDVDLASLPAPDDTNNRFDIDLPDVTWPTIAAGDNFGAVVVCYDANTGGGTDADIVPLCVVDFPMTTDGSSLTLQWNALGFFSAA